MRTILDIDREEKKRLFNERWPAALAKIDRTKFSNRKRFKAKVGWARKKLWSQVIRELLAKET